MYFVHVNVGYLTHVLEPVYAFLFYVQVFTWGCNDEGALGRKVKEGEEFSPGCVQGLSDAKVVQISAGDSHTAALTSSGEVYCWGVFRVSCLGEEDENRVLLCVKTAGCFD